MIYISSDSISAEAGMLDIIQLFYFCANLSNTTNSNNHAFPLTLKSSYLGPKMYNTIPEELRTINRKPRFKKKNEIVCFRNR